MRLVEQWQEIERALPEGWTDARLRLTVTNEMEAERAAALLGPFNPFRRGKLIRFSVARRGAGLGPEHVRRLLRRLDEEWIEGELELVAAAEPAPTETPSRATLAESWDAAVTALPSDWSDLYAEVELYSSDYLERAALLLAPLNPSRYGGRPGFRFRAASHFGYGASPQMVRRALERLDEDGIRGEFRILRTLSDTHPVGTQGPVWYVGGKAV
jgi:hypothetical protein